MLNEQIFSTKVNAKIQELHECELQEKQHVLWNTHQSAVVMDKRIVTNVWQKQHELRLHIHEPVKIYNIAPHFTMDVIPVPLKTGNSQHVQRWHVWSIISQNVKHLLMKLLCKIPSYQTPRKKRCLHEYWIQSLLIGKTSAQKINKNTIASLQMLQQFVSRNGKILKWLQTSLQNEHYSIVKKSSISVTSTFFWNKCFSQTDILITKNTLH